MTGKEVIIKIDKFELNDFLILRQDTILTKGGSWVYVLKEFQRRGLVELVSQEKPPSDAAEYLRTEKGKNLYETTLEVIEGLIDSALRGKLWKISTKKVVKKSN